MTYESEAEPEVEADPWAEFRNPDGTFKYWLHTWAYSYKANRGRKTILIRPCIPVPWLWGIPPDGEFIWAMVGTGYTKILPGNWEYLSKPRGKTTSEWMNGKLYGAVFENHSDSTVGIYLARKRAGFLTQQDFLAWLNNNHVLFSRSIILTNGDSKS